MADSTKIKQSLLDYGKTIDPKELFPVVIPEASAYVLGNPFAFAMAICLDRQTLAKIIWTIPYDIYMLLGHLHPRRFYLMSLDELKKLFSRLPRKPRFVNDAPKTVKDLTKIVVDKYNGDASKIWQGRSARDVVKTFQRIHGVGPGIANMSVLLIEKAFGIRFSDLDRRGMDIKPDVHTMRVLYRLSASGSESEAVAVDAARKLNPVYPGEIDAPLWIIGRKWCHAQKPQCKDCPMRTVCPKVDVSVW